MKSRRLLPSVAPLLFLLATPLLGQDVLYSVDHLRDGQSGDFGRDVIALPDRDGDGIPDFAVAAPTRNFDQEARLEILSGASGSLLQRIDGPAGGHGYATTLALLADIEADGYPEIVVSSPSGFQAGHVGVVEVRSGRTGRLLLSFSGLPDVRYGQAIAGAPDLSGDGVPDILIGTPDRLEVHGVVISFPMLQAYSGADGSLLWDRLQTVEVHSQYGESMAVLDDLDGDGISDIAVGAPGFSSSGRFIELVSGATGTAIGRIDEQPSWNGFAQVIASLADLDGDGVGELGLGFPSEGGSAEGAARVVSPVTGDVLFSFAGQEFFGLFGSAVQRAGDLDLDGLDDILVGETLVHGSGRVHAFSGADGSPIFAFDSPTDQSICCGFPVEFGFALADLGDLDGDGMSETAVGAPGAEELFVLSFRPDVGASFCTSLPTSSGAASEMRALGSKRVATDTLIFEADNVPPGQFGIFFYGEAAASVPFGNGIRCVGAGPAGLARLAVHAANAAGLLVHGLDFSAPPSAATAITAGSTWRFQAWFRDTPAAGAGFNFSSGLAITFEP
jgi:hypothetical protein